MTSSSYATRHLKNIRIRIPKYFCCWLIDSFFANAANPSNHNSITSFDFRKGIRIHSWLDIMKAENGIQLENDKY